MPHNLKRELAGIALIALALFIGGALLLQDLPIEGGCLAARGVFGPVGGCLKGALLSVVGEPAAWLLALLWVLNQSDGGNDLLAIAERSGMPFRKILAAAGALEQAGLLRRALQ